MGDVVQFRRNPAAPVRHIFAEREILREMAAIWRAGGRIAPTMTTPKQTSDFLCGQIQQIADNLGIDVEAPFRRTTPAPKPTEG
ncbi:hypothetical protein [Acidisoma cladoniae]|uniref:hypothetical protein n=1 Tax=Acidisoma cladoniae TaxID=3040935 RepID=UPI00254A84B4|nr:hypothetical protein [Acidisoma sp. PAMC 29798]